MSIESQGYKQKAYKVTRSDDSKDLKKVLVGALAGAAAGSVIAGLFTQKGIETRKRISDESKHIASNIASNIKEKASTISGDIKDKFETTKESAAHLLEKGKQKVGISQPRYGYEKTAKTGSKVSESKVLLGALAVSVAGTV
ncbi:MAG TPA: hypothetical protein VF610_10755, partial [Segetibacter sp.]